VAEFFTEDYSSQTEQMLDLVLDSTDLRIEDGKRVNPAFMFAAILWYPMNKLAEKLADELGLSQYDAIMEASNVILDQQVKSIAIPRRHTATIREVWQLQLRLPRRNGKRAQRLMELNKFRAGFDFLEMRGEIEGGETQELAKWWERYQSAGRNMRQAMANDVAPPSKSGHRRRKTYRNKKSKPSS
jgi:poly(A) polymerase